MFSFFIPIIIYHYPIRIPDPALTLADYFWLTLWFSIHLFVYSFVSSHNSEHSAFVYLTFVMQFQRIRRQMTPPSLCLSTIWEPRLYNPLLHLAFIVHMYAHGSYENTKCIATKILQQFTFTVLVTITTTVNGVIGIVPPFYSHHLSVFAVASIKTSTARVHRLRFNFRPTLFK
jgi:hypothetical protein